MIKTVIIRLEENAHSCQMAKDCFIQAEKFGLVPEYFKAINGNDAEGHYTSTGIKKNGKFKKEKLGVLGCFFSHYYLWNKCVDLNEPIIILEHDGYFIKQIDNDILNEFEDILKLDEHDPYQSNYNQLVNSGDNIIVKDYINPLPKNLAKYNISNYFKGAYSYIIKPQGAKKLITSIKADGHRPADQQIHEGIVDLKTTAPTVARLHPFYSIGSNIKTASLTRNLK